jgi:hypothetical protein
MEKWLRETDADTITLVGWAIVLIPTVGLLWAGYDIVLFAFYAIIALIAWAVLGIAFVGMLGIKGYQLIKKGIEYVRNK